MTPPEDPTLPVAYLTTARLGEKGQLTLPKAYRDAVALDTGAPITVLQVGSGLLLIPEDARFRALCDRVAATFARHGVPAEAILETYRTRGTGSLPATTRRSPTADPRARVRHGRDAPGAPPPLSGLERPDGRPCRPLGAR